MTEERREKSDERQGSMLIPPRLCRGKLPSSHFPLSTSRSAIRNPRPSSPFTFHPSRRKAGPAPTGQSGFTMLEMLVVIAVILALAALTSGVGAYAHRKAGTSRAKAEIAAMETALESFKVDNGVYPLITTARDSGSGSFPGAIEKNNSRQLYGALSGTIPPGSKQYFSFKLDQLREDPPPGSGYYIIDPFGSPYNYYCSPPPVPAAQTNQVTFDLWSYGLDHRNDTADDITNWKQ